jgi:ATP-dependent exoDNAse (exonuclease V) alpha subunit
LVKRQLLTVHNSPKAAVEALVAAWEAKTVSAPGEYVAMIARTNAEVRAINAVVRQRLKDRGEFCGQEIALPAVDDSGHGFTLRLAAGDRIRFLQRNDRLAVINGTEAVIEKIRGVRSGRVRITARHAGERIAFSPAEVADAKGRVRLAHGYALTLFQAQGMTVDTALILASTHFDRHSAYVAVSRARNEARMFVAAREIDADLAEAGLKVSEIDRDRARLDHLAKRMARESIKTTTLDLEMVGAPPVRQRRERFIRRELEHEH